MAKNKKGERQGDFRFTNQPTKKGKSTMSRSNPTNNNPNPCQRWMEWDGSQGIPRYYDRQKKERVEIDADFTFILLDETATITGFNEAAECGFYSNEVRDTRVSPFVVKLFKKGIFAEGLYAGIRDKINANGGYFTNNCYMAFKDNDDALIIGCLQLKGASLNAWVEFKKSNRKAMYEKAIHINGCTEHKKGKIVYRVPVFEIRDLSEATNAQAVEVDKQLQEYFDGYFKRTHTEQSEQIPPAADPQSAAEQPQPDAPTREPVTEEDDVPF